MARGGPMQTIASPSSTYQTDEAAKGGTSDGRESSGDPPSDSAHSSVSPGRGKARAHHSRTRDTRAYTRLEYVVAKHQSTRSTTHWMGDR